VNEQYGQFLILHQEIDSARQSDQECGGKVTYSLPAFAVRQGKPSIPPRLAMRIIRKPMIDSRPTPNIATTNVAATNSNSSLSRSSYTAIDRATCKTAEKKAGAGLAIKHYLRLPEAEIKRVLDEPILKSIYARLEPYLYALGISYDEVLASI
jgi:hypothetical protein